MKAVYFFESKDYSALKKVLDADPLEKDSFATIGYTLKDSKALGFKGGSYVLFFELADDNVAKKLVDKLKAIPSAREASREEFEAVTKSIEEEQNAAQAGFGSIFQ